MVNNRAGARASLPCLYVDLCACRFQACWPLCISARSGVSRGSADDELNDPPDLLAALKPDSNGPRPDVIHHHGTCLVDSVGHLTHADGADHGISVEPAQGRIARPGNFAPDKGCPVLQRGKAPRIQSTRQLMDRTDPGKDLHGRLHRPPRNGRNLRGLITGPQGRWIPNRGVLCLRPHP